MGFLWVKMNEEVWMFVNKGAMMHFWVTSAIPELAC